MVSVTAEAEAALEEVAAASVDVAIVAEEVIKYAFCKYAYNFILCVIQGRREVLTLCILALKWYRQNMSPEKI